MTTPEAIKILRDIANEQEALIMTVVAKTDWTEWERGATISLCRSRQEALDYTLGVLQAISHVTSE
jgi:hypothetical protein